MGAHREVSLGWVPVNEAIVDLIEKRFNDGTYHYNKGRLKEDIKMDISLFAYYLRKLTELEEKIDDQISPLVKKDNYKSKYSPSSLFKLASLDQLHSILKQAKATGSLYSFQEMERFQAVQLHKSLIGAIASESLASRSAIDPDLGYTCGLLKNFGRTLLSWNYPEQYEAALSSVSRQKNIEQAIGELMGFTPSVLGISFARSWNLNDDIVNVLCNKSARGFQNTFFGRAFTKAARQHTLKKVCELGTRFAEASIADDELTDQRFDLVRKEIIGRFGQQGLDAILQKAEMRMQHYQHLRLENSATKDPLKVKSKITQNVYQQSMLKKNRHLEKLPDEIAKQLRELYRDIKPGSVDKKAIRKLVKEISPKLGFNFGCVYLYDSESHTLVPALGIGSTSYKTFRPVKTTSKIGKYSTISSAFALKSPLKTKNSISGSENVEAIASTFGTFETLGVLYAEHDYDSKKDQVTTFRALAHCLADCLNTN